MSLIQDTIKWLSDLANNGDVKAKVALSQLYAADAINASLDQLEKDYKQLNEANMALSDQVDHLLAARRDLEQNLESAVKQIEQMKLVEAARAKELDSARAQLNVQVDMEDEIASYRSAIGSLEGEVSRLKVENKHLRQNDQQSLSLASQLQRRIDDLEEWGNAHRHQKPLKQTERQVLVNGLKTSQQERQLLREQNLRMRNYLERLLDSQVIRMTLPLEAERIRSVLGIVA